jgi:hypothetical protein
MQSKIIYNSEVIYFFLDTTKFDDKNIAKKLLGEMDFDKNRSQQHGGRRRRRRDGGQEQQERQLQ